MVQGLFKLRTKSLSIKREIKYLAGVGPQRERILRDELGVVTFGDLLEYYPFKYIDRSRVYRIKDITTEMPYVQIAGRILGFETFPMGPRKERVVAHFTDGWDIMDLTWFNGGKWARQNYGIGKPYMVFGRPTVFKGRYNIVQPEVDAFSEEVRDKSEEFELRPVYSVTEKMRKRGWTSRFLERLMRNLFDALRQGSEKEFMEETLTKDIVERRHLMGRAEAMENIHFPRDTKQLERARVRLKFEELFYVQLNILKYAKENRQKYRGNVFSKIGEAFNTFYYDHLPFKLTEAQKRVLREIRKDVGSGRQMNRLLQGDVGSGKTLVALMAMLMAKDNGYQACIMAPTEILAEQHLQTINEMIGNMDIRVELLTGVVKGKRREAVMDGLANGEVDILVGTHAIIEDNVRFNNLGIAVVDEQHRFGVAQRAKMWAKNTNPPHVLVMTATPIPRTLAMTLYGDLDVSVIDELPPGRKPIETMHVFDNQLPRLYESIRGQIENGRQVYMVFPLIEESGKIDLKNLEQGYEMVSSVFPDMKISKVHGKMKAAEKEEEMRRFVEGETQIMVATTVIEVGVNVPNASVMVIFDTQRFGLSQLHQLRGRVGRGADQSYCVLVTPYKMGEESKKRIDIMCETNDGFRIAEADLKMRGPGDLEGTMQSGMAFELRIANLARDGQIVQMAREEASIVINEELKIDSRKHTEKSNDYSLIWRRLAELRQTDINWSAIS